VKPEIEPWLREQLREAIDGGLWALAIGAENGRRYLDLEDYVGLEYSVRQIGAYTKHAVTALAKLKAVKGGSDEQS
jgi:hypothetical protein